MHGAGLRYTDGTGAALPNTSPARPELLPASRVLRQVDRDERAVPPNRHRGDGLRRTARLSLYEACPTPIVDETILPAEGRWTFDQVTMVHDAEPVSGTAAGSWERS